MTISMNPQDAEAERLAAYLISHGHDAYAMIGAIGVVSSWYQQTPNGAFYKSETWETIIPTQIAVDEWLLAVSN